MKPRWRQDEIDTLLKMRAAGEKWIVIACVLGRSEDSCISFLRDRRRRDRGFKQAWRPQPRRGDRLLLALASSFQRFADDNGITPEQAQVFLLGGKNHAARPPGSEVIHKTCSIARLNAANPVREAA